MSRNKYAKVLQERQNAIAELVAAWNVQLALDVLSGILNDPGVMGAGNALGASRLEKVGAAFNERFPEYSLALSLDPEADYMRAKIDEQQRRIFKDKALPWEGRYADWMEVYAK